MGGTVTIPQLRQLVGNPNAYAVQHDDGSWHPVHHRVTPAVLRRHLAGDETIGTYVNDGDQARTLVFDIDTGERAGEDALAVSNALEALEVPRKYIAQEWSGRKGFHVWVVIEKFVDAAKLMHLGAVVKMDVEMPKLEVFPKQAEVKQLGNLVKLPGGLHRVSGKRSEFVTEFPEPMPVKALDELLMTLPVVNIRRPGAESRPTFPCMEAIQEGVEEGGRNNSLFHLAVMLRRSGVADEFVEHIIETVNGRSEPPLEQWEVESLLDSSRNAGPICNQLPDGLHCGDACVFQRQKGLYTRPGQIRHAAEGEYVVVTLAGRDGDKVRLTHEDLRTAAIGGVEQRERRGWRSLRGD